MISNEKIIKRWIIKVKILRRNKIAIIKRINQVMFDEAQKRKKKL